MATMTTVSREHVVALRDEAAAKVAETVALFASLTPAQAAVRTEIGWTVAATAAHLALAVSFSATVMRRLAGGKGMLRTPAPLLNALNFVGSHAVARQSPLASARAIRQRFAVALPLFDTWDDTMLDTPLMPPFRGLHTYGDVVRYSFIGHFDEHAGQVRRALGAEPRAGERVTTVSRERVLALRDEAAAKVAETVALFASLTPAQAAVRTEIGWTVAATAAHLAFATGYTATVVRDLRRGKVRNIPMPVLDAANFAFTRIAARRPLDQSVPRLRHGIARALPLLDDWTDAELDVRFAKPFLLGATTHGEALHNVLIDHQDMHAGQVRRALGMGGNR